ncbi:MAG: LacI family transcriptional regulator [Thermoflavifilum sp.]|nr:LacI family transcriptional regulator [Thermoflavifilum sp.]
MKEGKEVTIYDIARQLHISPATVSRGLNDHPAVSKKTRQKILEVAQALGYQSNTFASSLRKQRTNTLGVIVPKLNSHFVSSVLAGIEKVANEAGYNLIISQSLESAQKEVANAHTMFKSRVDGLIVSLAFDTEDLSHFQPFFKKGIPVIFFDRVALNLPNSTHIIIDNQKAGYEATRHLIEQGCRHIIHITGHLARNVYADRLKGYRQALNEYQLPFSEQQVIVCPLDEQSAWEIGRKIADMKPLPDGLFITNDTFAAICMHALKEKGIRIPADMAIVGFNDDLVSRVVEPPLTTIHYPGQEMGELVARHLINHLKGTVPLTHTHTIIIHSELIIRASSLRKI